MGGGGEKNNSNGLRRSMRTYYTEEIFSAFYYTNSIREETSAGPLPRVAAQDEMLPRRAGDREINALQNRLGENDYTRTQQKPSMNNGAYRLQY